MPFEVTPLKIEDLHVIIRRLSNCNPCCMQFIYSYTTAGNIILVNKLVLIVFILFNVMIKYYTD